LALRMAGRSLVPACDGRSRVRRADRQKPFACRVGRWRARSAPRSTLRKDSRAVYYEVYRFWLTAFASHSGHSRTSCSEQMACPLSASNGQSAMSVQVVKIASTKSALRLSSGTLMPIALARPPRRQIGPSNLCHSALPIMPPCTAMKALS